MRLCLVASSLLSRGAPVKMSGEGRDRVFLVCMLQGRHGPQIHRIATGPARVRPLPPGKHDNGQGSLAIPQHSNRAPSRA